MLNKRPCMLFECARLLAVCKRLKLYRFGPALSGAAVRRNYAALCMNRLLTKYYISLIFSFGIKQWENDGNIYKYKGQGTCFAVNIAQIRLAVFVRITDSLYLNAIIIL